MKRNIYKQLLKWKNQKHKKPLIVLGQRQIGKTYIINKFANCEYKKNVYLNFMNYKEHNLLFENLNGFNDLLTKLMNYFSINENEISNTLFFFDEIQECNNAIAALKMINESSKKINVICSGSYLGYNIKTSYLNFPIGQVEIIHMYQMMFDEFVEAFDKKTILDCALEKVKNKEPIDQIYHEQLMKMFNDYLIIGGFPEVVKTYIENKNTYNEALKILEYIHLGYQNDINKYSQLFQSKTFLNLIYANINKFLIKENKKFVFQELNKNYKYRELEKYLVWMNNSNLVIKVNNLKNLSFPLISNGSDNYFKLYYNDHGFLSLSYNVQNILNSNLFNNIKGSLYENFVVTQLQSKFKNFFYYSFIKNGKRYEVDFVVENDKGESCLIEVKSSQSFKIKSLKTIDSNNKYVLSPINYKIYNDYINIPIYLTCILDEIIN